MGTLIPDIVIGTLTGGGAFAGKSAGTATARIGAVSGSRAAYSGPVRKLINGLNAMSPKLKGGLIFKMSPNLMTQLRSALRHFSIRRRIKDLKNVATKGLRKPKYTDAEIDDILRNIRGKGFKNNPLRVEYETKVMGLKQVGDDLLKAGYSEEVVARMLYQMRRDLGIKYKDMTPQPLRDYIYEFNINRYGDPLGPTFEYLMKKGKSFREIIDSASSPNKKIDELLSGFEDWLKIQEVIIK
jgi:hypothetical protein